MTQPPHETPERLNHDVEVRQAESRLFRGTHRPVQITTYDPAEMDRLLLTKRLRVEGRHETCNVQGQSGEQSNTEGGT